MVSGLLTPIERAIDLTVTYVTDSAAVAIPRLASAVMVVILAFIAISVISKVARRILLWRYDPEETLVIDLAVMLIAGALWFGVALTLLTILGLDDIAASTGTAVGFIALGVSYALSDMIEDTVSGVYLLRDPDFNRGDVIVADKMTGEVLSIGLRKSRFKTEDDDIAVLANRNVESDWTRRMDGT